jgi:hypothetical protein
VAGPLLDQEPLLKHGFSSAYAKNALSDTCSLLKYGLRKTDGWNEDFLSHLSGKELEG